MNPGGRPQKQGFLSDMRTGAGAVTLICQALAVSSEVHLRRGFGVRYMGLQAALAAVAIPCFCIFFPHDDPRPLQWFMLAYLGMCAWNRMGSVRRALRGDHVHSRYNGTPLLGRVLPRTSELTVKRFVEPAVVFTLGLIVMEVNRPLGAYLLLSAFGLSATTGMIELYGKQRAQDMYDAFEDQRDLGERFRRMRGDSHLM